MDRFLRYTTQKEPALTASFLAAVLLAIAARYLGLTDEDLAILGPVMLIVAGVVIRAGVFAPGHGPRPAGAPTSRTNRDRASLPGLPARHVPPGAVRRLRWRDDDAARVRLGVAEASGAAAAAASGVRVAAVRARPRDRRRPRRPEGARRERRGVQPPVAVRPHHRQKTATQDRRWGPDLERPADGAGACRGVARPPALLRERGESETGDGSSDELMAGGHGMEMIVAAHHDRTLGRLRKGLDVPLPAH